MSQKILLVDDSKSSRASIKKALEGIFKEFIEAENGLVALKAFVDEKPDFIITDIEMPSIDGYRLVSSVRGMDHGKDVPIILISGTKDSLKKKLTGFNIGASDFLIKPYDDEELVARVKSLLKMRNLLTELTEKNLLLEKLAVTDELTGVPNRRYFFDSIKRHLALAKRYRFRVACMLLDIDNFKSINDTYGHMAGDEVLRKIGALLKDSSRGGELVARFGGEEFVICLFNTDPESSLTAAERFRELIKEHDFTTESYPEVNHITASIGVAITAHENDITIDELLKVADKSLYQSKSAGRDRVSLTEIKR